MNGNKILGPVVGGGLALVALLQLVPYGRSHQNPPVGATVAWDSPRTEELVRRACWDCHSNETKWPWYSNIAPISWRVQRHVDEGREKLNFTDFQPGNGEVAEQAGESAETVQKGEMPLSDYLLAHPEARLTAAEKQELIRGLQATFAAFAEKGEGAEGGAAGGAVGEAGAAGRGGEAEGTRESEEHEREERAAGR